VPQYPPSEITLRVVLTETPVPPGAAPAIIDAFDDTLLDAMFNNSTLASAAVTKHCRSMAPSEVDKLLYQGRYEILNGLLDSPENRSAVMESTLGSWELSSTDLARLAARALPKKACDTLLYSYRSDLSLAANIDDLVARASGDARIQYLARTDVTDQDLFALLTDVAPSVRSPLPLISVLLARPGLRALALGSGVPSLITAACWCELAPGLHETAADAALALSPPAALAHAYNPVIGLLNQPTLGLRERQRLEAYVHDNKGQLNIPSAATRGLSRELAMTATPIAERTLGYDLDALVKAATVFAYGPTALRSVTITTPLLFELSKNPNLSANQTLLVTRALLRHYSILHIPRNLALFDAMVGLITRIDDDSPAGHYVTKFVKDRVRYVNDPLTAAFGRTYETSVANPHYQNRAYYQSETKSPDWEQLLTTPIGRLTLDAALQPLGTYLQDALGDGNDDASVQLWRRFFEHIVIDNSLTVPELVIAAMNPANLQATPA
jgi:hypothetical protein